MIFVGQDSDKIHALILKNNLSLDDLYDAETTYETIWERAVDTGLIEYDKEGDEWVWDLKSKNKVNPEQLEGCFQEIGEIIFEANTQVSYWVNEIKNIIKQQEA